MSYRVADGYMYAIRNADLLRIDANGVVTKLATLDVVPGAYTGVFGDDGKLHISHTVAR